jgi:anaerobic dimethyl sulfoxide reductase subunit B (iron-sulfur subunit)
MSEAVFQIDESRCTACGACVIACHDRANLADDLNWLRLETEELGRFPHVRLVARPSHCWHCADPVCVAVCPTGALFQRGDWVGLRAADCVACGACEVACPFGCIVLLEDGTASKCDGCADEVAAGSQPTCVRACPMRALSYGPPAPLPTQKRLDPTFADGGIGPRVQWRQWPPPIAD